MMNNEFFCTHSFTCLGVSLSGNLSKLTETQICHNVVTRPNIQCMWIERAGTEYLCPILRNTIIAMNRWQTVEVCDKMLQRVQVSRVFQSVEVCATVSAWAELLFLGVSRPLLTMTKPYHTMVVLDHSITITTATPPQDSRGNPGGEQCERASPGAGSTKPTLECTLQSTLEKRRTNSIYLPLRPSAPHCALHTPAECYGWRI